MIVSALDRQKWRIPGCGQTIISAYCLLAAANAGFRQLCKGGSIVEKISSWVRFIGRCPILNDIAISGLDISFIKRECYQTAALAQCR